jgi:hypothetical protein
MSNGIHHDPLRLRPSMMARTAALTLLLIGKDLHWGRKSFPHSHDAQRKYLRDDIASWRCANEANACNTLSFGKKPRNLYQANPAPQALARFLPRSKCICNEWRSC